MFHNQDIVTIHLLQGGSLRNTCIWYAHEEPYVPHDIMIERMIGSTSSSSNLHGVVYDNINPYRSMIMDVIEMN